MKIVFAWQDLAITLWVCWPWQLPKCGKLNCIICGSGELYLTLPWKKNSPLQNWNTLKKVKKCLWKTSQDIGEKDTTLGNYQEPLKSDSKTFHQPANSPWGWHHQVTCTLQWLNLWRAHLNGRMVPRTILSRFCLWNRDTVTKSWVCSLSQSYCVSWEYSWSCTVGYDDYLRGWKRSQDDNLFVSYFSIW